MSAAIARPVTVAVEFMPAEVRSVTGVILMRGALRTWPKL
jgi:hypothetical protein